MASPENKEIKRKVSRTPLTMNGSPQAVRLLCVRTQTSFIFFLIHQHVGSGMLMNERKWWLSLFSFPFFYGEHHIMSLSLRVCAPHKERKKKRTEWLLSGVTRCAFRDWGATIKELICGNPAHCLGLCVRDHRLSSLTFLLLSFTMAQILFFYISF
jgi:hypothetical protein